MVSSSRMKDSPKPRQLKTTRQAYECLRCGYRWTPYHGKRPRRCARCRSPYWDVPRREADDGRSRTGRPPEEAPDA
jgi:predicted Zn-ribbon and HTH transcriptional regulator